MSAPSFVLLGRDGSLRASRPGVRVAVRRYTKSVYGGPTLCEATATGALDDLLGYLDALRGRVVVQDDRGAPLWWGYLESVEVVTGALTIAASIESMANSVVAVYTPTAANESGMGAQKRGTAAVDAASQALYGAKEMWVEVDVAADAQAGQVASLLLSQVRYPVPSVSLTLGDEPPSATLTARGWWATLAWKHYAKSAAALTDTATQLVNIVADGGQFLAGVRKSPASLTSGVTSNPYRFGDTTALAEAVKLMDGGTANARRLLVTVDSDRWATVSEEPAPGVADWTLDRNGTLRDVYGAAVDGATCPVGMWIGLRQHLGMTALNMAWSGALTPVFVDEATYDVARDEWRPRVRNVPSVWDLGALR